MVPTGKETNVLISVAVGAVVDFLLNILRIPEYGAAGAALATTIAELAVLLAQGFMLRDMLKDVCRNVQWLKIGMAVLGAGVTVKFIKMGVAGLNTFMALVVSSIVFFGIYGVILLLNKEPQVREIIEPYWNKVVKRK